MVTWAGALGGYDKYRHHFNFNERILTEFFTQIEGALSVP
jgi:hypothetical protein